MACSVPKCDTSYWNKSSKGITMFAVNTDKRVENWTEILQRQCGLERKLNENDRICILHFREDVIERERTVFLAGGKVHKEHRTIPILSPYANPTMFPTKSAKPRRKKSKIEYCVLLGPGILEEQRRVFREAKHSIDSNKKVKKRVQLVKRNLGVTGANNIKIDDKHMPVQSKEEDLDIIAVKRKLGVDVVPLEDVRSQKVPKLHDIKLYEEVINAIHDKRIISKYLNKSWIPNLHGDNEEFASWTLWKENCSGCLKRIVLHKNLKVDVYLLDKSISLPEMYNISSMCDFEKLAKKVTELKLCIKAQGNLGENDCLGFVTKNFGRPRLRCDPCSKVDKNSRRRVCPQYKEGKKLVAKTFLVNRCTKLHRKNKILKKKVYTLEKNVRSLKAQYAGVEEKAVEKAIEKRSFSEQ